ncbi:mechanosensitive ion channel family protein [[Phormidium] sp. ETS-05]|uniref:mechanosensitive ion channel family protein n=1 Tax=[Phormidium] sp. ETS-05 TaxID=222819 RepID=UPI0018EF0664|nr:mechanosensitive ion channel domain-containing protein [[Phormidium] sp. ETS-05]
MAQAATPAVTPAPPPTNVPAEGKSEKIPQVGKGSSNFLRKWLLRSDLVKAPVILDGRLLFEVSQLPELTAAMRAENIQTSLETAAESSGKIQVKVQESKAGQIILVNDQYLLTVTEQDTSGEETRATLAQTWATEIETALNNARRERTINFIAETAIHGLVVLVLAVVTNWGLTRTWQRHKPKLEQLVARLPQPDGVDLRYILNGFLNLLQRFGQLAFWLGVSAYIANLFPLSRQLTYPIAQLLFRIPGIVGAIFTNTIFTLGRDPYSLSDLLMLSALLFALVNGAGRVSQLMRDRILQIAGINRGAREALATIVNYSAIALGTIIILQIWGIDLSSLTIIASALGVGIAFGFQDIAKNFASGLVLLFERPIQVGDFVEVGEYTGTVERIGSRSTTIRTLDRISIILPNSRFLEQEVINWSHQDPISRIHIPVGVAYGSDIKAVETALLDTAKEHPHVLKVPPPRVMFKGFGNSSLDFELLVWSNMPEEQYWTKSDLYFRIEQLFQERQIEIPFPQQDLHLRSGTFPLELSPELQQAILLLIQSLNKR